MALCLGPVTGGEGQCAAMIKHLKNTFLSAQVLRSTPCPPALGGGPGGPSSRLIESRCLGICVSKCWCVYLCVSVGSFLYVCVCSDVCVCVCVCVRVSYPLS